MREFQQLVAAVSGPRLVNDSRESWLRRGARHANVSYRQIKALFYGEVSNPHSRLVRKVRSAAGLHEAVELAERFESLAASLSHRSETRARADIDRLIAAANALRGLGSG
jgi:hypothetical protein